MRVNYKNKYMENIEIYNIHKNNRNCIFILYETAPFFNSPTEFNVVKITFYKLLIKLQYMKKTDFFITVDDDEFLYSSNMKYLKEQIKSSGKYTFHFIESYQSDKVEKLKFCLQPWYYNAYHGKKTPYAYHPCKTYLFDLNKNKGEFNILLGSWRHGSCCDVSNRGCELVEEKKDNVDINELKNIGICYHITGLTLKNLWYVKGKNRFSQNCKNSNYKNFLTDYPKIENTYKIFEDEFVLTNIIQKRDIELLKECDLN